MHNFLVTSNSFPQPDQASSDLHFFTLLSLLARKHDALFCILSTDGTTLPHNDAGARLEQTGITLDEPNSILCAQK